MNKTALRVLMIQHDETYKNLADVIGCNVPTFSNKINEKNGIGFTQPEIQAIKNHYGLSAEQIDLIFFGNEVS